MYYEQLGGSKKSKRSTIGLRWWHRLPLPLEELPEVGLQPLDPVLALIGSSHVPLVNQHLSDLSVHQSVGGGALQTVLDILAAPYFQEGLGLAVTPDLLGILGRPLCRRGD